jgi:hypothetical protein
MLPGTEVPEEFTRENVMVLGCTASLNVTVTVELGDTLMAPDAGVSMVTIGAADSAVLNDHVKAEDMATPLLFLAPLTIAV